MFGKNLVLYLWSKILSTNQNAEFFKLQYIENYLSYEVKLLHIGWQTYVGGDLCDFFK